MKEKRINTWFLKDTVDYVEYLRDKLAKTLGVDTSKIKRYHAEKAMVRLSKRGNITKKEAEDIYIGRI